MTDAHTVKEFLDSLTGAVGLNGLLFRWWNHVINGSTSLLCSTALRCFVDLTVFRVSHRTTTRETRSIEKSTGAASIAS